MDKNKITNQYGQEIDFELPKEFKIERSRIMYIEDKSGGLEGNARIGRVYFSKSGKTLYYRGLIFQSLKGMGFKSNYVEIESGNEYWISGPRKDKNDKLYGGDDNDQLNLDKAVESNQPTVFNPNGQSNTFIRASVNNHFWYGLLSTLKYDFNETLSLSGGGDARSYEGD